MKQIKDHIDRKHSRRCVVLVTGLPLSGKKIVCQRAAGLSGLVPYLHVSDDCAGFLQLARSIATWFQYVDSDKVRHHADAVKQLVDRKKWSRAHDECVSLINAAVSEGLRACFVIDRVQFLDDFSISLVRECLHELNSQRNRSSFSHFSESASQMGHDSDRSYISSDLGQISFLCVHVSLYNLKSASHIAADIRRSHRNLTIPIVKVGEASRDELRQLFTDLSDLKIEDRWLDATAEASGNCAGYFVERAHSIGLMSRKLLSEGKQGFVEITEELIVSIPPGSVRLNKQVLVGQISADVAMRFSQVFDGLPPLFQTFSKVLAVSSQTGFYKLHRRVMWEVLNDLIADGVEAGIYKIVVDELIEMGLVKIDEVDDEDVLSFQCPALRDIAFDVSTPVQVKCIGHALIERLDPGRMHDFKVPFVIANLHDLVGDEEEIKEELWVQGYAAFLQQSKTWETKLVCEWRESLDDEVRALRRSNKTGVLNGIGIPCMTYNATISEQMRILKAYQAPLSFGPMGHTLTVICRNVFHEYGAFHGYNEITVQQNRSATSSACHRYLREMIAVEDFLTENGFPCDEMEKERLLIDELAKPAVNINDVDRKVTMLLEEFVAQFVENRLTRLHLLANKFHTDDIPDVVDRSEDSIKLAYIALRSSKCRSDAAQDALMVMATRNWKPKLVPEFLPLHCYQTVSRIRNKVLKRLSDTELSIYKHRLTVLDLEVFLIVTPLLYEAQENGVA